MTRKQIDYLKSTFQPGVSIRLISMHREPQMPSGLSGKVSFVDDAGSIFTNWTNGSSLALCPEADKFIAFDGPSAVEYLHEKYGAGDGTTVWFRENPNRFQITAVPVATLVEAAERYIDRNVEITSELAVIMLKPYNTVTLLDSFIAIHVLSDEEARKAREKTEFTSEESDEERCPKCGSDDLSYGTAELGDGAYVEYPWICKSCGSEGKEYGTITFDGHEVKESPFFEEVSE